MERQVREVDINGRAKELLVRHLERLTKCTLLTVYHMQENRFRQRIHFADGDDIQEGEG